MAIITNAQPEVTATNTVTLTNKTLTSPTITDATFTGQQSGLQIAFNQSIVFEGTTADAFETTLSAGEPTADRVITLPDSTDTLVGKATTDTLTNKTLTSPIVSGLTLSDGSVVFEGATADAFETTLTVTDPTADRTITIPDVTGTVVTTGNLTAITTVTSATITSPTITGAVFNDGSVVFEGATADAFETTLAITDPTADRTITFQDATGTVVLRDSTDTLTNKTLTSPTITSGTLSDTVIKGIEEDVNVVASAATGTINFDVSTASVWYYTSNASANHTLNFRYSSGTTLSSVLAVGDAITLVWMNTNGATAYYPNTIQIDGTTVTPKVPAAISSGNANAIDVYSFTIVKTAATPTYTVLESQSKFA